MKHTRRTVAALAALLAAAAPALAAFPDKPVRLVIPAPPGGALDSAARIIGERLAAAWGQPVTIDNRAGASGAIATESMLKAAADGYTVLIHSPIMLSTELTRPAVAYRTLRDFAPAAVIFTTPIFFIASNEAAPGAFKDVLAAGAAGGLSYGSHGLGTTTHYMGERLRKAAKVDTVHVPFAGDAPIVTAVIGGHVKTGFVSGTAARKAVDTGKARALAVASPGRSPLMPAVPSFQELGVAGFDRESWSIAFVPAATPKAVVEQLARDIDRVVKSPEIQKRFLEMGLVARGSTPEEATREVQTDLAQWARLIEEFGVLAK
jgi:tripartite-type tricarboxylate transporter receptor subunit TctC